MIISSFDLADLFVSAKAGTYDIKSIREYLPQHKLNIVCLVTVFRAVTQSATSLGSAK